MIHEKLKYLTVEKHTQEMDILKVNCSKSVDVFGFFDHYLKIKKRFVLIY